jgi:hypothetical protein
MFGARGKPASDARRLFLKNKLQFLMIQRVIVPDTYYADDNDVMINQLPQLSSYKLKIKCKKRYRFEKATLYEREVIKKQNFFIRRQKLPYSYNMW